MKTRRTTNSTSKPKRWGVLGKKLKEKGLSLAYHTHDAEMRNAAREFHHMLRAVPPELMGFCLDNHWLYRGSGNSQVALDDSIGMYGDRIITLHLRQSQGGVWAETLGPGDVDFTCLANKLKSIAFSGPILLELAMEVGTPSVLGMEEAHRRSVQFVKQVFPAPV